jgi:hypothetical protein
MDEQPRRRRRTAPAPDTTRREPDELPPIVTVEERRQEIPRNEPRPELRADTQPSPREETSRERAERMTAEILEREEVAGDFVDKFPMPAGGEPDGWHYEWKRKSVMGFSDPSYAIALSTNGWRAVPTERHPEFMPVGGGHLAIEREGMILMEIPKMVWAHRQQRATQRAHDQVKIKHQQLTQAGQGQFERDNKGNSLVNVKRSYVPLAIPPNQS